jgi:hypothetical protein
MGKLSERPTREQLESVFVELAQNHFQGSLTVKAVQKYLWSSSGKGQAIW